MSAVLVPIDVEEMSSWRALTVGVEQARLLAAPLLVLAVVEHIEIDLPDLPSPAEISRLRAEQTEAKVRAAVDDHLPEGLTAETRVVVGNVHRKILEVAAEVNAALIVMASHRPALRTYLLGTHAARVVRHAPCSVYVVRPDAGTT
jgi:nucleotide-binding universal stress UspA family protein